MAERLQHTGDVKGIGQDRPNKAVVVPRASTLTVKGGWQLTWASGWGHTADGVPAAWAAAAPPKAMRGLVRLGLIHSITSS